MLEPQYLHTRMHKYTHIGGPIKGRHEGMCSHLILRNNFFDILEYLVQLTHKSIDL